MTEKSLGKELVGAVKTSLEDKEGGRVVRPKVDVTAIRSKLHLTQKEFAKRYHIKLETVRNWEQQKRLPDSTSRAYLSCIVKRPTLIQKILEDDEE